MLRKNQFHKLVKETPADIAIGNSILCKNTVARANIEYSCDQVLKAISHCSGKFTKLQTNVITISNSLRMYSQALHIRRSLSVSNRLRRRKGCALQCYTTNSFLFCFFLFSKPWTIAKSQRLVHRCERSLQKGNRDKVGLRFLKWRT